MQASEALTRAIAGEMRWLARCISWIELGREEISVALSSVEARRKRTVGRPHVLGITGPPGAGKSTFVNALIRLARKKGERVAVVAVDPSSPFSGGAILGDRVRMEEHTQDEGVYVRSLSSRGHLGGLSSATYQVVDLLDVCGFDLIIVETVGVGQSELGVMEVADTVVVILTPESGDSVQAMKAGLLEIADVFVVNKADRPGADRIARELARSVELAELPWPPTVLKTDARDGTGVEEVLDAASGHLRWCVGEGQEWWQQRRKHALERLFFDLVAERAVARAAAEISVKEIESEQDVHRALEELTWI